ncbi:MAG TPA: hypothetical protein VN862_06530 [Candidatus Acidoferrales bacterium]|nr:hypothetical protein [Candidatus Acidoferrales bacterium]
MPDPTPDNHVETRFEPDGKGTLITTRMTLPNAQTRAAMLATRMERGMEASYLRLEGMISLDHSPGSCAAEPDSRRTGHPLRARYSVPFCETMQPAPAS